MNHQGDTVYFKNPTMYEVDDGIGDIQGQITDKQVLKCILFHEAGDFQLVGVTFSFDISTSTLYTLCDACVVKHTGIAEHDGLALQTLVCGKTVFWRDSGGCRSRLGSYPPSQSCM